MDHLSPEERSKNMGRIHSKNTKPEIRVRSILHRQGYRYRIHVKELPGKPDLYFPKYKLVVFVQGCFWHQHENCKRSNIPKSNKDYWITKLNRNVERDRENKKKLEELGLSVLYIWECETKDPESIIKTFKGFIDNMR